MPQSSQTLNLKPYRPKALNLGPGPQDDRHIARPRTFQLSPVRALLRSCEVHGSFFKLRCPASVRDFGTCHGQFWSKPGSVWVQSRGRFRAQGARSTANPSPYGQVPNSKSQHPPTTFVPCGVVLAGKISHASHETPNLRGRNSALCGALLWHSLSMR